MLVFRSFALGLLGACCLLLAQRPSINIQIEPSAPVEAPPAASARIVDVAFAQLDAPDKIFQLLALAPDERIVAVDDQQVRSEDHMREVLGHLAPATYVDFDVASPRGRERVLMLFH